MGMRLPAYPLQGSTPVFNRKMLISDLNSAAVAAVEIQASANRPLAGLARPCSCRITVTSLLRGKARMRLNRCSGRNRCKPSTLINNAGNTVRRNRYWHGLLQPLRLPPFLCFAACLALDQCCKHCHIIAVRKLPIKRLLWRLLLRACRTGLWCLVFLHETAPLTSSESVT